MKTVFNNVRLNLLEQHLPENQFPESHSHAGVSFEAYNYHLRQDDRFEFGLEIQPDAEGSCFNVGRCWDSLDGLIFIRMLLQKGVSLVGPGRASYCSEVYHLMDDEIEDLLNKQLIFTFQRRVLL